jgi:hypothetical protein
MIISDQTSQDDYGHPNQERQYRQPSDGAAFDDYLFPVFFVFPQSDLKGRGNKRPHGHQEHFEPKRKGHQFAYGLPNHHQDSRRQQQTQGARQPWPEPIRDLPQCLIQARPSHDSEIDHEHGSQYDSNAEDMDGLDCRNYPAVMVLDKNAEIGSGQPLGKLNQSESSLDGENRGQTGEFPFLFSKREFTRLAPIFPSLLERGSTEKGTA